jgi:hypothetical protein
MKVIQLTRGKVAVVDDEDFTELAQYRWYCTSRGYAVRVMPGTRGSKKIYMHKAICASAAQVDHINGDQLDNRRCNLRPATMQQNLHNRGKFRNNTSGFKGVHVQRGKYVARIAKDGKRVYLGHFDTAEAAHTAYCAAATEQHGDFARFN